MLMDKQTLFNLYDDVNSVLGFSNVNCAKHNCNFCETKISKSFLFPFEDEYLSIKNKIKIPVEERKVSGIIIKNLKCGNGCKFYKNNRCSIQGCKPIECKIYPFLIWECRKSVNLELDLRCPEALSLRKDKAYLNKIFPPLKKFVNSLPRKFFIARGSLPSAMGSNIKMVKIAVLRKI